MIDIVIIRRAEIQPIIEIGAKFGVLGDALIQQGSYKAKLSCEDIKRNIEGLFYGKWKN